MLEAGVPEGVIREIAGHVDPAMTMHYSHPRLAARRAAVETLMKAQAPSSEESHVTNHVTKQLTDGVDNSQVVESIGTPGGIRTPDLLLRRQPLYPSELQAHATASVTPANYRGQGFQNGFPKRQNGAQVSKTARSGVNFYTPRALECLNLG